MRPGALLPIPAAVTAASGRPVSLPDPGGSSVTATARAVAGVCAAARKSAAMAEVFSDVEIAELAGSAERSSSDGLALLIAVPVASAATLLGSALPMSNVTRSRVCSCATGVPGVAVCAASVSAAVADPALPAASARVTAGGALRAARVVMRVLGPCSDVARPCNDAAGAMSAAIPAAGMASRLPSVASTLDWPWPRARRRDWPSLPFMLRSSSVGCSEAGVGRADDFTFS